MLLCSFTTPKTEVTPYLPSRICLLTCWGKGVQVDEGKWRVSEDGELTRRDTSLYELAQRPSRATELRGAYGGGRLKPILVGAVRGKLIDRSMTSERGQETRRGTAVNLEDLRSKL